VPFLRLYSTSYFSRSLHTPRRHLMFFVTGRHTTPSIGTLGSGGICKDSVVERQGWRGSRAGGVNSCAAHAYCPACAAAYSTASVLLPDEQLLLIIFYETPKTA
jgi:hypothetical protein